MFLLVVITLDYLVSVLKPVDVRGGGSAEKKKQIGKSKSRYEGQKAGTKVREQVGRSRKGAPGIETETRCVSFENVLKRSRTDRYDPKWDLPCLAGSAEQLQEGVEL